MKIPKATKLPSGSWNCRLRIQGQEISITKPTEKEAVAEAMAIKSGIMKAAKSSGGEQTVRQALDAYIESRRNILSPSTIRGYCILRDGHFSSVMGAKLSAITQAKWQQLVNAESRFFSAKTMHNAWGLMASAIKYATGETITVRLPQIVHEERAWLTPEQIPVFVEAIHGDPAEITALLALSSLRRSEIMALRWEDVDLKAGILHVRGAAVYDENYNLIQKKESKNHTSRRTVPIIPPLQEALTAANRAGDTIVQLHPTSATRRIRQVCQKNGLPEVSLHGLRHSFASLAYHLQMPEKIAMEIGGWSDLSTMRNIYTHISRQDKTHYRSAFTDFFKK